MIERLAITNFKAFDSADIRFGRYTLLSGLNSSGKSTVLQALALLRQGANFLNTEDCTLPLNGELVQLGTGRDILHEEYAAEAGAEPEIMLRLSAPPAEPLEVRARYGRDDDFLPATTNPAWLLTREPHGEEGKAVTLLNAGFQYLRADRVNPAVTYPRSHEMSSIRSFLGTRGEYTADYLLQHQDDQVHRAVLHDPGDIAQLLAQADAWLAEICPGVRVQATEIELADLVRLSFQFTRPKQLTSEPRRPTHVGFGLAYVLPIVVACLTARPHSLLLLENPEAHLHPQGQSAMARLTCAAAAAGAQVIVETHSDHILNGVRLAVKREILAAEDVVLHYFDRQDHGVRITSPAIGADGMLSQWPPGFFDEWDRSLDQLLD
jgi:predicted ATPase